MKEITLRSISTPSLNLLSGLKDLWSVDVKLGGIKDFNAFKSLPNLEYLELGQLREISDITFISDLTALQHSFIQSLPDIKELPYFNKLNKLRHL